MKTKIIFLFAILFYSAIYSQPNILFEHCATAGNINGDLTEIDHPAMNNDPSAHVQVMKVRKGISGAIINNPHNVGMRYNPFTERWYVHNEFAGTPMIENSCYLISIAGVDVSDIKSHKVTSGTILPGFDNTSVINHAAINDNSSARCMCTKLQDADEVQNNNPIELYYNWLSPGSWYISTPSGQVIPIGSAFSILCNPPGFSIVQHESLFENVGSEVNSVTDYAYWTILDHVLLNNNPNAFLFVNHRREPATTFIYSDFSVFYNSVTGKWQLHIELESYISGFSFPIGNFFDIFIWDGTLDTSKFNIADNLKVYPNPSNSVFTVEAKHAISGISIFNILGQKLVDFSGEAKNKKEIDLSNYDTGHYFAKIETGNALETVKLIKN